MNFWWTFFFNTSVLQLHVAPLFVIFFSFYAFFSDCFQIISCLLFNYIAFFFLFSFWLIIPLYFCSCLIVFVFLFFLLLHFYRSRPNLKHFQFELPQIVPPPAECDIFKTHNVVSFFCTILSAPPSASPAAAAAAAPVTAHHCSGQWFHMQLPVVQRYRRMYIRYRRPDPSLRV